MAPDIFISSGEASSDLAAALLVDQLKRLHPDLKTFGMGGPELLRRGMEQQVSANKMGIFGVAEWWSQAREVFKAYDRLSNEVYRRKPDLAILLDLPDFNLRLAKRLHTLGIPVVYYLSPQVWAWRKYRIYKIRKLISKMLVVFPFEKKFYEDHGVEVSFVGHPLVEQLPPKEHERSQSEISKAPRIAVLPGSRKSEVRHHLGVLEEFVTNLRAKYPQAEIRIPVAATLHREMFLGLEKIDGVKLTQDSWDTLYWADAACVASGTATLETALIGTPFSLFYRVSSSSAWVFKNLIRYRRWIGMPNILLEKEAAKEFFQEKFTAEALLAETSKLIEDESYRGKLIQDLQRCRSVLGDQKASQVAAWNIHEILKSPQKNNRSGLGQVDVRPATT